MCSRSDGSAIFFLKKVWTPLFSTNAACGLSTETFYKVLSWIVLFAKLPSMKNTTHYNISRSRMSSHNQVWILLKSLDTSVQHQWGTLSLCGNRFSESCVCWTICNISIPEEWGIKPISNISRLFHFVEHD